jgi:hypothetical protein
MDMVDALAAILSIIACIAAGITVWRQRRYDQQRAQELRVGFTACWSECPTDPTCHCRKPQGHDGDCAYF